jgi:hypothetical protein
MTASTNGDRPAYPSATGPGNKGLSQRDYFAAAAMNGLLAGRFKAAEGEMLEFFAKQAYEMADAMLKERSKSQEGS